MLGGAIAPAWGFSDTRDTWAEACIDRLAERALVSGYPDGSFRPDATVSRAEFAILMLNAFPNAPIWQAASTFSDVAAGYWAERAIRDASERRFFTGYPDGSFRPQQPIPRVQAIAVVTNALRPEIPEDPEATIAQYFEDAAAIPDYAVPAVAASARQWGVVNHPFVRRFQPDRNATRAEVAALLCRALEMRYAVPLEFVARPHPLLEILPEMGAVARGAEGLFVVRENGLLGYRDRSGNPIVAPRYNTISPFSEQFAAVGVTDVRGTRWGYIDRRGALRVEPQFSRAAPFAEGRAAVAANGKFGFIDSTGQFAIAPQFDEAQSFSEGLAAVRVAGEWQYIDRDGNVAIAELPYDAVEPFSEGRARVTRDNRHGFIDSTGREIIAPQFAEARSFAGGLAAVVPPAGANDPRLPKYLWGYIDRDGEMAISPQFVKAQSFSEGLAGVAVNPRIDIANGDTGDLWGFITPAGTFAIAPRFYAPVRRIPDGELLVAYEGTVVRPFSQGLAMVRLGERVGFADKTGAFAVEPAFVDAESFQDGLARVRLGGEWILRVEDPYPGQGPPSAYFTEIDGGEYGYIRHPDPRLNP